MFLPETYTLHVELRDDAEGIWLCLDNGNVAVPLAEFVSEEAANQFKQAMNIAFAKAHQMGRAGI